MARKAQYIFNAVKDVSAKEMSARNKKKATKAISKAVLEQMRTDLAGGKSPVTGRQLIKLTKDYANAEKGGDRTADLELSSKMLNSMTIKNTKGNTLKLDVGSSQQDKARGHNQLSGDRVPQSLTGKRRQFIPDQKQTSGVKGFNKGIRTIINTIIEDFKDR